MKKLHMIYLLSVAVLLLPIPLFSAITEVGLRSTDPFLRAKEARKIAETGVYSKEDINLLIGCLGDFKEFHLVYPNKKKKGEYIQEDQETSLSKEAQKALLRIGKPAVPSLLSALKAGRYGTAEGQITFKAAKVLGEMREPTALPRLKQLISGGEYGHQNEQGADDEFPVALAKIARKDAYELLRSTLTKAERANRLNSGLFEAVGFSEDERFVPVLEEYLGKGDRYRKIEVIIALGHTKSKKAVSILLPFVNSEDEHIKDYSRHSLKELGRSDLIPKKTK